MLYTVRLEPAQEASRVEDMSRGLWLATKHLPLRS